MSACQELSELYELYALGSLDGPEFQEIESHLRRDCPVCSPAVQRARSSMALLATLPEQVDPPARLRKRILSIVQPEKSKWNWLWMGAWATATAALAIGIFVIGRENNRRGSELAQLQFEIRRDAADLVNARMALQFLNEPETRQVVFGEGQPKPPHGRVMLSPNHGVMLMVSNLPSAPAGKLYEMWLIPKGGAPKPAGLFQSDAQGRALYFHEGAVSITTTGAVAVTLEPVGGSPAPTTTPLFVAAL